MSRLAILFLALAMSCSRKTVTSPAPAPTIEIGDQWIVVAGEKVAPTELLEREERSIELDQALERLAKAGNRGQRIVINARPKVAFLVVKRVMVSADQAGFHDVDFAVLK